MNPAPLQLIDYWATSIRMDACTDYDPDAKTQLDLDSITVEHHIKRIDSPDAESLGTRWLIGLSIEQCPCLSANFPYTFALSLQGIVLALPGAPDEEMLERAVKANGPAMLFGAAREIIRTTTARGPHHAVMIPSTNFLPLPQERKTENSLAQTKQAAKSSAKKSPSAKKSARKRPKPKP